MENDFGRCETLLAGMLATRPHWLPYLVGEAADRLASRVRDSLAALVAARLARAQQLLPAGLLAAGVALCRETARHLHARGTPPGAWCEFLAAPTPSVPNLRHWQALAAMALTAGGKPGASGSMPAPALRRKTRNSKRRGVEWLAELAAQRGALELFVELQLLPDPELSADETDMLGYSRDCWHWPSPNWIWSSVNGAGWIIRRSRRRRAPRWAASMSH